MDRPPLEWPIWSARGRGLHRTKSQVDHLEHVKVLLAIARCRTAVLGGHLDECTRCGYRAISYNSAETDTAPKCQAGAPRSLLEKASPGASSDALRM